MKLSELPENYRKTQGIEDFSVGDVIYYEHKYGHYREAKVQSLTTSSVIVKHSDCTCLFNYYSCDFYRIYVQDKEPKHNFKVNDRVTWSAYDDLIGTITHITDTHIDVLWSSSENRLSKGTYSKAYWSELKPVQEPKLTKEITLDVKLNFNLDTSGIETVLVDCVKALVSNGKYQEAKELCELLVSVQSLGKEQEKTKDDTAEGT